MLHPSRRNFGIVDDRTPISPTVADAVIVMFRLQFASGVSKGLILVRCTDPSGAYIMRYSAKIFWPLYVERSPHSYHGTRATVEICEFPRQVSRLMAFPRQILRLWPRHVPRFCPWQTPSYQPWQSSEVHGNCHGNFHGNRRPLPRQRGNRHGIPRTSAAIATAVSADVQPQLFPRPSAAARGHCHRNPPIVIHIIDFQTISPYCCH